MRTVRLLCCAAAALALQAAPPVEGLVVPYRQVEVASPVSSRVVDMLVREGDTVKAGQPLAQLYGRLEELEMKRAKALLDRREYEAKGAKNLYDNKVIPEAKAMEYRVDLELARLNFETASEQFRLRTILSPIDGLVVERRRELGEAVSSGQTIFRILDLSKVYIVCSVKPDKAAALAVGQKLTARAVHVDEPPFQAEVTFIAPNADPSSLVRVKLLVDPPGPWLRAGLKAMVELPD